MLRRPLVWLVATVVASSVAFPAAASASPLDDKQAEATRIQRQIDANGSRIAALGERYNGARLAYEQAAAGIASARARYDAAQREVDAKRRLVESRAVRLYTAAAGSSPLASVDVSDVNELGRRTKYSAIASESDQRAVESLRIAQEDLEQQRKILEARQASARTERDAAAAAQQQIGQANAAQQRLLGQVKGQIAQLVEQQRRERDAARSAAARARPAPPRSSGRALRSVDPGSVGGGIQGAPAPNGRVAAVIAYARAQLGKPYVFATAGPDTFDCSGLTKMAWLQAGVSMAHFSGAQFNAFPHVALSNLQPGDLVFKGPGGRDHVALYIGGGMQIAATHTGDFVRLQPLSRNLSGAVRPG